MIDRQLIHTSTHGVDDFHLIDTFGKVTSLERHTVTNNRVRIYTNALNIFIQVYLYDIAETGLTIDVVVTNTIETDSTQGQCIEETVLSFGGNIAGATSPTEVKWIPSAERSI